jgi:hypothetical protein
MFNNELNINVSMRDFNLALVAGVERVVDIQGSWFHVQDADTPIQLQFNESPFVTREQTQGGARDYNRVTVLSATTQNVVLSLGFGQETDSRAKLVGDVIATESVANSLINAGEILLTAGQTKLLVAERTNRKETRLNIRSNQGGGLYVGNVGINDASKGGFIENGMTEYMDGTFALYAFNPNNFTVVINVLETAGV